MWAIRLLSGPGAGQIYDLKLGRNVIGRAPHCDIRLDSRGVSKEHSEITVTREKITLSDMKSSNGTYINGVKVQSGDVRIGDKISVHDVMFDIIPAPEIRPRPGAGKMPANMSSHGNAAPDYFAAPYEQDYGAPPVPQMMGGPQMASPVPATMPSDGGLMQNLMAQVQDYLDRVALPGVYRLAELAEFKYVLGGFIAAFIFAVTLLSMIPMVQVTRSSILVESKRRAQSLARNVAQANQQMLLQGTYSSLSTHSAEIEDGVKQVMIIQQSDGMVIAPASIAGKTPDQPFIHEALRERKSIVEQVDSQTIGATFPIGQYDPNTGEPSVKAHAVVLYDIGSLAFDDGHVVSLFMQTLIIACLVGLVLYFFMYKLIEFPIANLNQQLDMALREKKDSTEIHFQFPALQNLIGNINSLLTRYVHGDTDQAQGASVSREGEAENLIQLIGYPAVAFNAEGRMIAMNQNFEQLAHVSAAQMIGQNLKILPDAALQQNLQFLMQKSREVPNLIHNDQLEFGGHNCEIHCQALGVENGNVAYFVISITPLEGGE